MTGDLPFPLTGTTLLTGVSNVGKTRLTARALDTWIRQHGPRGVVVLDFGPEYEHEGRLLGRRLTRFTDVPDEAWYGVVDARAPRAESDTEAELVRLASDNADGVRRLLASAPTAPVAVFVNDTTIGFQHESGDIDRLLDYCDTADVAVLNAFESDELGIDDPVSRQERTALERLEKWADRTLRLEGE